MELLAVSEGPEKYQMRQLLFFLLRICMNFLNEPILVSWISILVLKPWRKARSISGSLGFILTGRQSELVDYGLNMRPFRVQSMSSESSMGSQVGFEDVWEMLVSE